MNVGFENPGHSSESKSIEGKGCSRWRVESTGERGGVKPWHHQVHPLHHTTIRPLLHFKAPRQSYLTVILGSDNSWNHNPAPTASVQFLSRRRIVWFASPRKGQNLCHFPLVLQRILEGTIGTHSTLGWGSILGSLKTIGFMISLSFLVYS